MEDAIMGQKSQEDNNHSFEIETGANQFRLTQDVDHYRNYAKDMRNQGRDNFGAGQKYRPLFIIPDIVAVDILTKYKLNVHADDFLDDPANMIRLKRIIYSEYPDLITSHMKKV